MQIEMNNHASSIHSVSWGGGGSFWKLKAFFSNVSQEVPIIPRETTIWEYLHNYKKWKAFRCADNFYA